MRERRLTSDFLETLELEAFFFRLPLRRRSLHPNLPAGLSRHRLQGIPGYRWDHRHRHRFDTDAPANGLRGNYRRKKLLNAVNCTTRPGCNYYDGLSERRSLVITRRRNVTMIQFFSRLQINARNVRA